mgnify:CR=1 FL=1
MGESNFIHKVELACQKKQELYTASKMRYAVRSMFAGAYLTMTTAVGVISADLLNSFVPGSGRFLFPFIFAWGLVYLLFLNGELTTSNMMYLTAGVFLKKIHWKKALEILLYCTFFNLVGAMFLAFLFNQTSAFAHLDPKGYLGSVVTHKLERSSQLVFFEGVIANVFVNVAILSYLLLKEETAKIFMALSAIYMFVFLANEHIAANFASFSLAAFNPIAKDLHYLEIFNVLRHYAVTFVGNWVGGGVLMGLAYAWLNTTKTVYKD